MSRRPLAPGSWGNIRFTQQPNGSQVADATFRRLNGSYGRKRAVARSKAAAQNAILPKLQEAVGQTKLQASSGRARFAALAEDYLEHEASIYDAGEGRKLSTINEERRLIRNLILPSLGRLALNELTAQITYEFLIGVYRATPSQARTARVALSNVLAYGYRLGMVADNYARKIKFPYRRKARDIFAPDAAELDDLRDAVTRYMECAGRPGPKPSRLLIDVIEVILGTSCRISEAVGLRWKDVDLLSDPPRVTIAGQIVAGHGIAKHWEAGTKSDSGFRSVPIPDHLVRVLLDRRARASASDVFVFQSRTGAPNGPQDVHRTLRTVRESSGLPATFVPHALRKSVATIISEYGSLPDAAKTLGHKESRITEDYYIRRAIDAPDMRQALDRLAPGASRAAATHQVS